MAVQIRCFGKVQGVFFRASTKTIAEDLGIHGWVSNEPDGTVLIHAEGPKESLKKLVEWSGKGPDFARVERTETTDEKNQGYTSFEIRR